MAGRGSKNGRSRTEAERARLYAARTAWHEGLIRRRVRDNTVAGILGGLIVVAAFASQGVHAQVNAPEPDPTETSTPGPAENPFATLFPTPASDEPTAPEETPAP